MNFYRKKETFRNTHNLNSRKKMTDNVLLKYPDKIPAIIESVSGKKTDEKVKFLLPKDTTMAQLAYVIYKRNKMDDPSVSILLFINGLTLVESYLTSEQVYEKYKDADGFLYIVWQCENTFG